MTEIKENVSRQDKTLVTDIFKNIEDLLKKSLYFLIRKI